MKHFLFYFSIAIILTACADKNDAANAVDSLQIVIPGDTNLLNNHFVASGDYYNYSDVIIKEGSVTLVTNATKIYSDSLLQVNTGIVLAPGEYITIEKYCDITTKNNWAEPVYKIMYKMGADIVHGYTSQSYIACRIDTLKSQKRVALTLSYNKSKEKFIGKISLFNRMRDIIATSSVELDIPKEGSEPYAYTYSFSFRENETCGLENIQEIFTVATEYGACGYPNFEYTFLWNGEKLFDCPQTFSVSEAGLFNQYSYLVFPADSLGENGSILKITEANEYTEQENSDNVIVEKDSTVIEYKWNANTYTISKGDTIAKKSRIYATTY